MASRGSRWEGLGYSGEEPPQYVRREAVLAVLLKRLCYVPNKVVTDKLRRFGAACRPMMPSITHCATQYANNRAEAPYQPTRRRERQMRHFKSPHHGQRFLSVHGSINNLFRVGRHFIGAVHYRLFRDRAFAIWWVVTTGQERASGQSRYCFTTREVGAPFQ